ncbi:MAG: class I mannose-6-phosphate isomerase [Fimbriimonas sp.]|nr:class I mannose-6-phosphate isomerase [Fimbriimonas sp.]
MRSRSPSYDKFPFVSVPGGAGKATTGWDSITDRLARTCHVLTVECYPGVDTVGVCRELADRLDPVLVIETRDLLLCECAINRLVEPFLGGDDPVFGFLSGLTLPQFFDPERVAAARADVEACTGQVMIVGVGASHIHPGDVLVYADLARWEAQLRFRRSESGNLGADNHKCAWSQQYKRAFFVDWRVADRWKRPLISRWDFVLDTHEASRPKLVEGGAVRDGLKECLTRPFRVVPFFDPAPWGGQWMREHCGLDPAPPNFGWCFDCVPEENSLYLGFGDVRIELPSVDLLYYRPRSLLGDRVYARFGDEFPIRFDFLDTIGGGNLSFQVHPTTEYIQGAFGMHYTQDESYYMLDAGPSASVYLGTKEGIDPEEMIRALEAAQTGSEPFDADRFVNRWPAQKHDHFLIPAGTVHCSGAEAMVLEISATPYIFTFKLWDWGRLGLDGKPRPIYLEHGKRVIDWNRGTQWTRANLVNRFETIAEGKGWHEERTGLHEMEFIETRRHWFTDTVAHDTHGGVNVLNLVEGEAAFVESPTGAFEPFEVHYAETFIVPASVGSYTIRPRQSSPAKPMGTMKAFVRT